MNEQSSKGGIYANSTRAGILQLRLRQLIIREVFSMKVTTILGSPKKDGNTAKVLGLFEEIISQDHEVARIDIATSNIKGCLGCHACQKVPDDPGCVQKDDV